MRPEPRSTAPVLATPPRRRLAALLLLLTTGAGSACSRSALIESRDIGPGLQAPVRGISYVLPKKLLKLEVWRFLPPEPAATPAGAAEGETARPAARVARHFATCADDGTGEMVVPDLRHQFVIVPRWDVASDDYLEVATTSDGLLTEVYGHATDERGTIASGITSLLSMLIAGGSGGTPWAAHPRPEKMRGLTDAEDGTPRLVAAYQFDPVDPGERGRVERALRTYGIRLDLTRQADCPVASSGAGCCTTCDMTQPGIYYRLPIPYRLSLTPGGAYRSSGVLGSQGGEWDYLEGGLERTVLLPNEAVCIYVPVERAAFVTSYTSLTFDRGMLTKVTSDKPSELVGFVKIPIDVASAVLAIPAQLLTLRIDQLQKRSDLDAAEARRMEAERQKLDAELQTLDAMRRWRAGAPGAPPEEGWGR